MLILFPLCFISLNPYIWIIQLNDNKRKFIVFQAIRLIIGIIFYYIINSILLIDNTISALIFNSIFVLAISSIIDYPLYNKHKKSNIIYIFSITLILLQLIYPLSITKDLYNLVDAKEMDEKSELINTERIAVVPLETAINKGKKLFENIENCSYYKIGEYSKQKINNELYWIAPIEYLGFFNSKNVSNIPGYIKISAEYPNDEGIFVNNYKLIYTPSSYFNNDIKRLIRKNYEDIIISSIMFEPNDEGYPYYVVSYGYYNNFRYGLKIEGIILVDPQTGKMENYSLDKMPEFIDYAISNNLAEKYNEYYGRYKHGLLNCFFGKRDIHIADKYKEKEVIEIYESNNKIYWFANHIKQEELNLMVGYSLMDARTGEFTYFSKSNNFYNGNAAIEMVNKQLVAEQLVGTSPLLYKIFNEDTWIIPIIDNEGNLKKISAVNAKTGKLVYGNNKQQLFDNYKSLIMNEISTNNELSSINEKTGVVQRINKISTQNGDVFLILLENDNKIYNINTSISPYAVFIEKGDIVEFSYFNSENINVNVNKFYNKTINK